MFFRLISDSEQNSSPEPKSEDSDNDSKNSARQHCRALIMLHSRCFTISLFSALHLELYVHTSDVQAVMDQCEENVYEIDITEYILVRLSLSCFCCMLISKHCRQFVVT